MPVRDLRVTLIGEDRTGSAFGSAGKNADGMGSRFAGFGAMAGVALAGAGFAAAAFAKTGVDAFARVEDATAAAGVTFGGATADVTRFAKGAAGAFGLSEGAALDAAITFGTMGKAAGLTGQELSNFSTDFAGLAGDMASFRGTSPEQAIEAIGSALRGESEPIRAYGVLLDDASMRQEALALGLIKTTKDALTPQQKVLAAQSLIYKQTSDAQGDFARTSDSTANTAKRLAAETENASARLGQQLAPAVTAARGAFLNLLQGASSFIDYIGPAIAAVMPVFASMGDFISRNSTVFKIVAAVILGVFVPALVTAGVTATATAVKTVAAWVMTQAGAVAAAVVNAASVARMVAGWVLMGAQALIQGARIAAGWVLAMGPVGWVIATVVGLVALIVANWDKVKTFTVNAWNAVTGFVSRAWRNITSAVSSGVNTAVDWVRGLPGRILGALGNLGSLLLDAGASVIRGFVNGIKNAFGWVKDTLGNLTSKLTSWKGPPGRDAKILQNAGRLVIGGFIGGMESQYVAARRSLEWFTGSLAVAGTAPGTLTARRPAGAYTGSGTAPSASPPATRAVVQIENYNEARRSPHEVAQDLVFLGRTGG